MTMGGVPQYLSSTHVTLERSKTADARLCLLPHSHSIVRIAPHELICRCKKFLRLENSRRPNHQMRMAFEFKEEFDRSRKSPLSATINIDRSTFLESTGDAAPPT
jgi:hypothetical protein